MISAGNTYLANYASHFNRKIIINPTTIDTLQTQYVNVNHRRELVTMGWTGSHSTLKYLEMILRPLQEILVHNDHIRLIIICNREPDWKLERMQFMYWNKKTEWEDLSHIQIGLMPLPNDPWTRGKCGRAGCA